MLDPFHPGASLARPLDLKLFLKRAPNRPGEIILHDRDGRILEVFTDLVEAQRALRERLESTEAPWART
jgi:hypothetical protein